MCVCHSVAADDAGGRRVGGVLARLTALVSSQDCSGRSDGCQMVLEHLAQQRHLPTMLQHSNDADMPGSQTVGRPGRLALRSLHRLRCLNLPGRPGPGLWRFCCCCSCSCHCSLSQLLPRHHAATHMPGAAIHVYQGQWMSLVADGCNPSLHAVHCSALFCIVLHCIALHSIAKLDNHATFLPAPLPGNSSVYEQVNCTMNCIPVFGVECWDDFSLHTGKWMAGGGLASMNRSMEADGCGSIMCPCACSVSMLGASIEIFRVECDVPVAVSGWSLRTVLHCTARCSCLMHRGIALG